MEKSQGRQASHHQVDTLVVGGGVAGFSAALAAAKDGRVLLVTKDRIRESNTAYAQGGVAAVLGEDDSEASHVYDTLSTGQGLCEREAVEIVVREGPDRIGELLEWGGAFDREGGEFHLSREGGHSHHRILHANGDATGKEFVNTLLRRTREHPQIGLREYAFARDLLVEDGRCLGVVTQDEHGCEEILTASATILCTGGAGQVYRETTNPEIATGDGLAMALRAGAATGDMEFVQFHPTTLYIAGSARHLITEAVRGEGGFLVDGRGQRFVFRYHPDGELAPRDVVSRASVQHLALTGESNVWLDLTHLGSQVKERFPGLMKLCALYNLDITKDRIPVHPSAHYTVGGVLTDLEGRTSLPGLYAAGEVALSGLHGANRLASNSLLEGLVFGQRAGAAACHETMPAVATVPTSERDRPLPSTILNLSDMKNSIQSLMWRSVGILRDDQGLKRAKHELETWAAYVKQVNFDSVGGFELENILTVALAITRGALWRQESRGTHYRTDFPQQDDERFLVHSMQDSQGAIIERPVARS